MKVGETVKSKLHGTCAVVKVGRETVYVRGVFNQFGRRARWLPIGDFDKEAGRVLKKVKRRAASRRSAAKRRTAAAMKRHWAYVEPE